MAGAREGAAVWEAPAVRPEKEANTRQAELAEAVTGAAMAVLVVGAAGAAKTAAVQATEAPSGAAELGAGMEVLGWRADEEEATVARAAGEALEATAARAAAAASARAGR